MRMAEQDKEKEAAVANPFAVKLSPHSLIYGTISGMRAWPVGVCHGIPLWEHEGSAPPSI